MKANTKKAPVLSSDNAHPAIPRYVEVESRAHVTFRLPLNDAEQGALADYQAANEHFRTVPWPAPFDRTIHRLHLGDSRDLSAEGHDQTDRPREE